MAFVLFITPLRRLMLPEKIAPAIEDKLGTLGDVK